MAAFTTASKNTQVGAEFRDRFADDGHVLADELADHRGEARSAPRTACCSPASPVGPPRSVFGLAVVCRTTTEPGRIAASSPSSTQVCLTCSSVKTQTTTTSASLAAPAISSTASAPSSVTASRLSSVRPSARTWWPASTRRRTIGAPIRPAPMNPTRITPLCSSRSDHHRGWCINVSAVSAMVNTEPSGAEAAAARLVACRTSFCSRPPAWGASPSRLPPKTTILPSVLIALPRLAVNNRLFRILVTWPPQGGRGARWGRHMLRTRVCTSRRRTPPRRPSPAGCPPETAGAPPLTGASITEIPLSAADLAISRQVSGCTVLWISTMPPGAGPASTPVPPSRTCLSSSPTTHRQTRSLAAPTASARNLPRRSALTARSDEPDAHQPASTSTSVPSRAITHSSMNDNTCSW
ncbi:MAG: hypothetical protein QOH20_320 [Mycobacterium sp.]|nr:hypothetical protein [Mycobacterium sp.]